MATKKVWEIDFGDVEKALNLQPMGPQPQPVVDEGPPLAHQQFNDRIEQQLASNQGYVNDGPPLAAQQFDRIAQQLGIGAAVKQAQQPVISDVQQRFIRVVNELGGNDPQSQSQPSPLAQLIAPQSPGVQFPGQPVDTGASPLTMGQAQPSTLTTPITASQQKYSDSAGRGTNQIASDVVGMAGNVLLGAPSVVAATPGYRALQQRNQDASQAAVADGTVTPMESLGQAGGYALGLLGLGADAAKTTKIPGLDLTPGQIAQSVVSTVPHDKNWDWESIKQQANLWLNSSSQQLGRWQGINRQIDSLPDSVRPSAELAMLNLYSGYDIVQSTLNDIINKDGNVASLIERARQAQYNGDTLRAATLGAQAVELKNTSNVALVDKKTSILPELGYTIVLDPLNAIGGIFKLAGLTPEAARASAAARLFDVTPEEALARLPEALKQSSEVADFVKNGGSMLGWWDKVNPFVRTAESLAAKDTNVLYRTIASLFGDVATKADAKAIMTALVDNPQKLISGLTNLSSESLAARAGGGGRVAFDAGVVANDEVLNAMPVLRAAAERLRTMASTLGEDAFNKLDFISEFDDIVSEASRRIYGLDKLIDLPVGTKAIELVKVGKADAFVRFLDAGGREAGKTAIMSLDNAKRRVGDLTKAINSTGGNFNLLRDAAQAQRAIMSEVWLNMRPAHWITNATSAYTHLFVDGLYTFKKTDQIVDDLMRLSGDILPSSRVAGALEGAQAATELATKRSIFRKIPVLGTPIAAFSELGSRIKNGNMSLFGRLAVGEQNFYMRAYHTAFRRVFNQQWERAVSRDLGVVFEKLGVDSAVAKDLISVATDAALRGGKGEMLTSFREAVNKVQTSFTLGKFGIQPEDISAEGQRALHEFFQAGAPTITDAIAGVNKIFREESMRWQQILKESAPEPGRYAWTTLEHMNDAADITDDLGRAAKLGGVDPAGIPQQTAAAVTQTEQAIYESLFHELAGETDPGRLTVAIDMWGQLHDAKQAVRQRLGALADDTIKAGDGNAWTHYFEQARSEWDNYAQQAQAIGDQARIDLQAGGSVTRRFDAWSMLQDYAESDEQALLQARQAGFDVGKTADSQPQFQRVLEAQRKFVDNYVAQAFSIFHRYPTLDALDVITSAQRDVDGLGAKAAGFVGEARDNLFANKIGLKEYYEVRNRTWYELADAQASRWKVAIREIVFDGEKEKLPSRLRFTDNFAGGEFELLKPQQAGSQTFWYARRVDDGTVHKFSDPTDKLAGLPPVPQSVINDYHRMVGELDNLVHTVAEDVKLAEIKAPAPRSNPIMGSGTATQVADFERNNPLFAAANTQPLPEGSPAFTPAEWAARMGTPPAYAGPTGIGTPLEAAASAIPAASAVTPYKRVPFAERNAGWKLHLSVIDEAAKSEVEKFLSANKDRWQIEFKIGRNSGQDGKDVTIYIGDRVAAEEVAKEIEGKIARFLKETHGDALKDDIPFGTHVAGRFDATNKQLGGFSMAQYGFKGHGRLFEDGLIDRANPIEVAAAKARAEAFIRRHPDLKDIYDLPSAIPAPSAPTPPRESVADTSKDTIAALEATKQDLLRSWDAAAGHINGMPSLNTMTAMLQTRTGGGTPDIKIAGANWEDSGIVRDFAERLLGADATGNDLLGWLRQYSDLNQQISVARGDIKEAKRFVSMEAGKIIDTALADGMIDQATADALRAGNANREEVLNMVEAAIGVEPDMRLYQQAVPAVDTAALAQQMEAAKNVDMNAYTLDAKAQLQKWFNVAGDGIQDLYKAISETNTGRASLGGTWQPGMGDYADYMNRRTEAARRKIIQNIESILRGSPNTLSPQQRLRAFDGLVNVARSYDGVVGTAAKAANDMADFAMLNYSDRRNIDNLIGMWTPYHFWFTRSMKNWIERSAMKPSLLAEYYKIKKAGDTYGQQNDLPQRLQGRIPLFKTGDTTHYIPNPIDILMPYNVYGLKGYDDPEEASNGFERAYMYAQMLGFGALPVYDAAVKAASGKGSTIQVGDYFPQYRALGYLYQAATGKTLPSAGDEFDQYRVGRQAGIEAIRGTVPPSFAQWAQDVAYQVLNDVGPLPEQPKEAQAIYESASKAAGWDRSLAILGSYFLGLGLYTYTDAEAAAVAAGKLYGSVGYAEDGNKQGSKAAKNAVLDNNPWLSAWWSRSSVAPAGSQSASGSDMVRPGAQASFNEMMQAKDQLTVQQNQQIDQLILNETTKGTPLADINDMVWKIRDQFFAKRDAVDAAHPSAAIPSSVDPYKGYNPQELGEKAYELAVQKAKADLKAPVYPGDNASKAEKQKYFDAKDAYDAQLLALVNGYMQDPAALVGDKKIDTAGLPKTAEEALKAYDQRYMTPIQKQLADAVAKEKAAKAAEYGKWNGNWNEYNALGDDFDAKRKYLADHPEFAAYMEARLKAKGQDAWWLKEYKQRAARSGGGGRSSGGGGRSYSPGAANAYSTLLPSIAEFARRTPKGTFVSPTINPVLWQMTGRRYGSK